MNKPNIQISLQYKLDNYNNIKSFVETIKGVFPEQTTEGQVWWAPKTSNYEFSVRENYVPKNYKGTKDFLNAIYMKEQVLLDNLSIYNFEKHVYLMLFSPTILGLVADDIQILEDYAEKIRTALGLGSHKSGQCDEKNAIQFCAQNYSDKNLLSGVFNAKLVTIIKDRLFEIERAVASNMPLAAMFLIGSTLEGALVTVAHKYPRLFSTATSAPKKEGKVLPFTSWVLSSLIDVAYEVGVLKKDVKDFSEKVRDYRNYIHPNEQVKQGFSPTMGVVKISLQVLDLAMNEIDDFIKQNNGKE